MQNRRISTPALVALAVLLFLAGMASAQCGASGRVRWRLRLGRHHYHYVERGTLAAPCGPVASPQAPPVLPVAPTPPKALPVPQAQSQAVQTSDPLAWVNGWRRRRGLPAFWLDAGLCGEARRNNLVCAADPPRWGHRVHDGRRFAQVVAWTSSPASAVSVWEASDGHRPYLAWPTALPVGIDTQGGFTTMNLAGAIRR